jgi:DNA-binding MarR family transcriptional regulator
MKAGHHCLPVCGDDWRKRHLQQCMGANHAMKTATHATTYATTHAAPRPDGQPDHATSPDHAMSNVLPPAIMQPVQQGLQQGSHHAIQPGAGLAETIGLQQSAVPIPGNGDQAASIARQVADMAQGLAALADRLVGQNVGSAATPDMAEADCIAFLEGQFRIRRLRARHLQGLSLGEPAWDILLDLAVAHYWRRETSVTSLCIAADVPSTTALRWINSMTREGLIVRRPCLRDGRRSYLAIAPASYQAMLSLAADALRSVDKVRARYQRTAA